jgi:NDP-sugar pyrophosphorylase family protein
VLKQQLFSSFGSLSNFEKFFLAVGEPWLWPSAIAAALENFKAPSGFNSPAPGVFIHESASISKSAAIVGPALVGRESKVGHCAILRENCIIGSECAVGSCCELKNCLLLDGAKAAHMNYIGDSVLGIGSHLGAGAVLSNLRLDGRPVRVHLQSGSVATGLRKFGALLGDGAQVGCNSVLQPGTVIGRNAVVYPTVAFGGNLPEGAAARKS